MLHPIHFESPIDRYHLEFPSEVAPRIVPPSVPVAALEGLEGRSRAAFLSAACERIASPMRPPIDPPPWFRPPKRAPISLVAAHATLAAVAPAATPKRSSLLVGAVPLRVASRSCSDASLEPPCTALIVPPAPLRAPPPTVMAAFAPMVMADVPALPIEPIDWPVPWAPVTIPIKADGTLLAR